MDGFNYSSHTSSNGVSCMEMEADVIENDPIIAWLWVWGVVIWLQVNIDHGTKPRLMWLCLFWPATVPYTFLKAYWQLHFPKKVKHHDTQ